MLSIYCSSTGGELTTINQVVGINLIMKHSHTYPEVDLMGLYSPATEKAVPNWRLTEIVFSSRGLGGGVWSTVIAFSLMARFAPRSRASSSLPVSIFTVNICKTKY
jgi:hypothetical protein